MDETFKPLELWAGYCAAFPRQVECCNHAPADGLSVKENLVRGGLFERVTYCVTKVEDHAQAVFALVFVHHAGLHADGRSDDLFERLRFAGEDGGRVLFHEADQRAVADDARFHTLHQAGAEFSVRQCAQHPDIGKHYKRVMKAADKVLAFRQVDAGFSSD